MSRGGRRHPGPWDRQAGPSLEPSSIRSHSAAPLCPSLKGGWAVSMTLRLRCSLSAFTVYGMLAVCQAGHGGSK